MKYCVNYNKRFKYNNLIDEVTITYHRKDTSLLEFLQLFSSDRCRVNIYIKDEQDFVDNNCLAFFMALAVKHPEINFALKLKEYSYYNSNINQIYEGIKNSGQNIPFFFETIVKDWDTLHGYINLHPTDIYIAEELCFQLVDVSTVLHKNNIKVRTFANVGQSAWKKTPALKKFFIRPEDVEVYEPYIDVIEFFGRENSIETYYKVYAIDKKWFGKLNEIILDLDTDIDSRFLLPSFAMRRVNCGKRCLKGRPCQVCEATERLSAVLEKHNLMISDFEK